jgi:two-component system, OmpR family, response regulator
MIASGNLELDQVKCFIRYGGNGLRLAAIEYRALAFLIRRAGVVVTYRTLAEEALDWVEYDEVRLPQLLSVVVRRIGLRLAAAGAPNLIDCIDGVGYRLVCATDESFDR